MPLHTDGFRRRRTLPELTSPGSLLETTPEGLTFRGTRRGISVARGTLDAPGEELGFQPAGGSFGPPQDELEPPIAGPEAPAPAAFKTAREYAIAEDKRLRDSNEIDRTDREFFINKGTQLGVPWQEIQDKLKAEGLDKYKPYQTPKDLLELMIKPTEEERLTGVEATAAAKARGAATVAKPPTAAEARITEVREQAAARLEGQEPPTPGTTIDPEAAALGGTGPGPMIVAAMNKISGGLGITEVWFPETEENRQILRLIKQTGKAALLNSARAAVWEQKRIDKVYPDPDAFWTKAKIEAGKFQVLREAMREVQRANDEALLTVTSKEAMDKLIISNLDIDRLFALIGTGAPLAGVTRTFTMPDGSTAVFDESGKRIQ